MLVGKKCMHGKQKPSHIRSKSKFMKGVSKSLLDQSMPTSISIYKLNKNWNFSFDGQRIWRHFHDMANLTNCTLSIITISLDCFLLRCFQAHELTLFPRDCKVRTVCYLTGLHANFVEFDIMLNTGFMNLNSF